MDNQQETKNITNKQKNKTKKKLKQNKKWK
jgi:hypothetical protein